MTTKEAAKALYKEGLNDYFEVLEKLQNDHSQYNRLLLESKLFNLAHDNRENDARANVYDNRYHEKQRPSQPQTVGDIINGITKKLGLS